MQGNVKGIKIWELRLVYLSSEDSLWPQPWFIYWFSVLNCPHESLNSAHSDSNLGCTFFHLLLFVFLPVTLCRRRGLDSQLGSIESQREPESFPVTLTQVIWIPAPAHFFPISLANNRFRTSGNSLGVPMFIGCLDFWTPKSGGGISIYTTFPQMWRSHHWFLLNPYIHDHEFSWSSWELEVNRMITL